MFSIIIPTLNEGNNIAKAISQFNPIRDRYDIEIIVSDSKSIDNTVLIAQKYADKVVVYNKLDTCNISKARNFGAKYAKNEILVFLDADILINNVEQFFKTINNIFDENEIAALSPKISIYPHEETIIDK